VISSMPSLRLSRFVARATGAGRAEWLIGCKNSSAGTGPPGHLKDHLFIAGSVTSPAFFARSHFNAMRQCCGPHHDVAPITHGCAHS
jgi:hypothetical protein